MTSQNISQTQNPFIQCKAITEIGLQCSREAKEGKHCTQHHNIHEGALPKDILKNVLSDYIEYDELKELKKEISNLKINKDRKVIKEYNVESDYNKYDMFVRETIIEGVVRKKETYRVSIYDQDYIQILSRNRYDKNGKLHGIQWEWSYNNWEGEKRKSQKITYSHGVKNGEYKLWYNENGFLEEQGTYVNGKMKGLYKKYNENGSLNIKKYL
jgi:antitoxin component YwqK of YwqJK toxin-antitoxin module